MDGLMVKLPYARQIVDGTKPIEIRNREVRKRGLIAIYAAAAIPCWRCPLAPRVENLNAGEKQCCDETRYLGCEHDKGYILGIVDLCGCRRLHEQDRRILGFPEDGPEGYWAWVLRDEFALPKAVACKPPQGAQVWFTLPKDVEAKVLQQTAREGRRA